MFYILHSLRSQGLPFNNIAVIKNAKSGRTEVHGVSQGEVPGHYGPVYRCSSSVQLCLSTLSRCQY